MISLLKQNGFRINGLEEPYLTSKRRIIPRRFHADIWLGTTTARYTFDFWPGECAFGGFFESVRAANGGHEHRPLIEIGNRRLVG